MIRKSKKRRKPCQSNEFLPAEFDFGQKNCEENSLSASARLTPRSKLPACEDNFAYSQCPSLLCGKEGHLIPFPAPRTMPNASGIESTPPCLCGKVAGHVIGPAGQKGKNKSPPPPLGRKAEGKDRGYRFCEQPGSSTPREDHREGIAEKTRTSASKKDHIRFFPPLEFR